MKKWIFLGFVVISLLVAGLFLPRIGKIECQTQLGACPIYYIDRVNYLLGKSWIFLPTTKEVKNSLSSYAEIADVSVSRRLPNVLVLDIKLHQPVGVVNNYLVDDGGKVLSSATNSALPRLLVDEQILPGKSLTDNQLLALTDLNALENIFPEVISASLSGQILQFGIYTTNVVLDVTALPNNWTDSLQLIFTRSKVEGTAPKKVDMRFNNPIIVY